MRGRMNKQSGFTLLEVVTSLSIFGFLMLSVLSFYQFQERLIQKEMTAQEVKQNGRVALNRTLFLIQEHAPLVVNSDTISVEEGGELIPLLDFNGVTKRAALNYLMSEDGETGVLVNREGEVVAEHISSFKVTQEDDLLDVAIVVSEGKEEFLFHRKVYLRKL